MRSRLEFSVKRYGKSKSSYDTPLNITVYVCIYYNVCNETIIVISWNLAIFILCEWAHRYLANNNNHFCKIIIINFDSRSRSVLCVCVCMLALLGGTTKQYAFSMRTRYEHGHFATVVLLLTYLPSAMATLFMASSIAVCVCVCVVSIVVYCTIQIHAYGLNIICIEFCCVVSASNWIRPKMYNFLSIYGSDGM